MNATRLDETIAYAKAVALWEEFSNSERHGVRFGLFPHEKMAKAEAELIDEAEDKGLVYIHNVGRLLSVALMECASRDGGMRA